jgi:hypothetical protein
MSSDPPAGNATTTVTGRLGQSCAHAGPMHATYAASAMARSNRSFVIEASLAGSLDERQHNHACRAG